MDIGLVSCTKSKRDTPSQPRFLYSPSTYFEKASTYAEETHDKWFILSAKHGLLEPDGPEIEPYDVTLSEFSEAHRKGWARKVFRTLKEQGIISEDNRLVIHASADYYEPLLPLLDSVGMSYCIPTEGLRFGETLAWYNEQQAQSGAEQDDK